MANHDGPDDGGPDHGERADARSLDELAANAMASSTVERLGGWQLRAARELPFRRANATMPFAGETTAVDTAARIELVERFYRVRGMPPRFQVSPAADPTDLDARLEARGYTVDAPVDVLVADTASVFTALASTETAPRARIVDAVDGAWVAAFAPGDASEEGTRTRTRIDAYSRVMATMGPRGATAVVDLDDEPTAIGLGVLERGWVGIFGMATRSRCRRRGAARAVLYALARWAQDEGASRLYLQVEIDNRAARVLYESVGFERNHGYHYRVLE